MIPGDRLICAFVDNYRSGDTFSKWPLHITIVPWFRAEASSEELGRTVSQRLGDLEPFLVTVGPETHMGSRQKLANLIEVPSSLTVIEQTVRGILRQHPAWMVDETTKKRRPFRPHITAQKAGRVLAGDTFLCDSLYIIEQKGDHKEVACRIDL